MLGADADVTAFLEKHDLTFLSSSSAAKQPQAPAAAEEVAPKQVTLAPRDVQQQLERLIVRDNVENEEVFKWVKAHAARDVKQNYFVRALITAICRSVIDSK